MLVGVQLPYPDPVDRSKSCMRIVARVGHHKCHGHFSNTNMWPDIQGYGAMSKSNQ
jgi:hypothetical protein